MVKPFRLITSKSSNFVLIHKESSNYPGCWTFLMDRKYLCESVKNMDIKEGDRSCCERLFCYTFNSPKSGLLTIKET